MNFRETDQEAEIDFTVDSVTIDDSAKRCPVAVLERQSSHAHDVAQPSIP